MLFVGWQEGHPVCNKFYDNNSQKFTSGEQNNPKKLQKKVKEKLSACVIEWLSLYWQRKRRWERI